jgi:large subunit ribosomal protein L4
MFEGTKVASVNTMNIKGKVKRLALKSALTTKVNEGKLVVVDSFNMEEVKTKVMAGALKAINAEKALVVLGDDNKNAQLSARNIPSVKTASVSTINVYDILKYDSLVVAKDAVAKIEEVYA